MRISLLAVGIAFFASLPARADPSAGPPTDGMNAKASARLWAGLGAAAAGAVVGTVGAVVAGGIDARLRTGTVVFADQSGLKSTAVVALVVAGVGGAALTTGAVVAILGVTE